MTKLIEIEDLRVLMGETYTQMLKDIRFSEEEKHGAAIAFTKLESQLSGIARESGSSNSSNIHVHMKQTGKGKQIGAAQHVNIYSNTGNGKQNNYIGTFTINLGDETND